MFAHDASVTHYLTDAFAGGHIRTARTDMTAFWNAKVPMFFHNVKGYMAQELAKQLQAQETEICPVPVLGNVNCDSLPEADVEKGALTEVTAMFESLAPIHFGDLVSLAIHDRDNEDGVKAKVEGKEVILKGDGFLGEGDERDLAVRAVQRSIAEVEMWASKSATGDPMEIAESAKNKDGLYAAEKMIPELVDDASREVPWKQDDVLRLVTHPLFVTALGQFQELKAGEIRKAAKGMGPEKIQALEDGLLGPMKSDTAGVVWNIINWTPSNGFGFTASDGADRAMRYYDEAEKTDGGLDSLTTIQRANLVINLLTLRDDPDVYETPYGDIPLNPRNRPSEAIVQIFETADDTDARFILETVGEGRAAQGWLKLHRRLEGALQARFEERCPSEEYAL